MAFKAALIWIAGLLTLVPYATYYLFFDAAREQYALLITFVLFWIFGYWGVVGPLLMIVKVRAVLSAMERAGSQHELAALMRSPESRSVAIDFIATDNHIPRFMAARLYDLLARRLISR